MFYFDEVQGSRHGYGAVLPEDARIQGHFVAQGWVGTAFWELVASDKVRLALSALTFHKMVDHFSYHDQKLKDGFQPVIVERFCGALELTGVFAFVSLAVRSPSGMTFCHGMGEESCILEELLFSSNRMHLANYLLTVGFLPRMHPKGGASGDLLRVLDLRPARKRL